MSLQAEAETLRDLADQIIDFEIQRAKVVSSGGVVYLNDSQTIKVTLTAQQKQDALAGEEALKSAAKSITAAW